MELSAGIARIHGRYLAHRKHFNVLELEVRTLHRKHRKHFDAPTTYEYESQIVARNNRKIGNLSPNLRLSFLSTFKCFNLRLTIL
jgi:hypothetical protein